MSDRNLNASQKAMFAAKAVLSYSDKLAEAVCEGKIPLNLAECVAMLIESPKKVERLLKKDDPKNMLPELLASVILYVSSSSKPKISNVKKHIRKLVDFFKKQPELLTEDVLDCLGHELKEFLENAERRDLAKQLLASLLDVVNSTIGCFFDEDTGLEIKNEQ